MTNSSPVYKLLNGQTLTKSQFLKYVEEKVFKTMRKYKLFSLDDKIVVAVSGGKDSLTVLYLTHKYLKRKGLEKNLLALAIDEGIENYRSKTLDDLEKFCKKYKIQLEIRSYKQKYGKTLDESIKKIKTSKENISACNICGTFRRQSLNTAARELGATKLVTGHNLDDEAQSILLNIFKNNFSILPRLGPANGVVTDSKFIPRVKPLYHITEKEVRLYTLLKGFDLHYSVCPYAKDSFRTNIAIMLNELEDKHKGVKHSIVQFYLQAQGALKEQFLEEKGTQVTHCSICGEPSQRPVCNTCMMKSKIQE